MGNTELREQGFEFARDAGGSARRPERCGAHLDAARAGQHKFSGVFAGGDAAHTDDRDLRDARFLMHPAQCDWLDGGAGESAVTGADARQAGAGVDGEGDEGVDERDGVGATAFGRYGERLDRGDVRRELYDYRPPRLRLDARDKIRERAFIDAEREATVFGVGAGDVQLIGREALGVIENANDFQVVFGRIAEDVRDDGGKEVAKCGELLFDKRAGSDVLESDRIDHAGARFPAAGRGVAGDRRAGKDLDHNAAEGVEIDLLLEFHTVAESARSGQHRVTECDAEDGALHLAGVIF